MLHHIVFLTSVMVQPWGLRIQQPLEAKCNPAQGTWRHMADPEPTLPPYRQYEWLPQGGCEMTRMSLDHFCDFMEKKKLDHIMFVGDSLSTMMAESFLSLTGIKVPVNHHHRHKAGQGLEGLFKAESNVTETEYDASFDEQQFSCRGNPITLHFIGMTKSIHRRNKLNIVEAIIPQAPQNVIHGGIHIYRMLRRRY